MVRSIGGWGEVYCYLLPEMLPTYVGDRIDDPLDPDLGTLRGVRMPGQQLLTSQNVERNYPLLFDLANDPKELWNIAAANNGVGQPMARVVGACQKSLAEHSNIRPGADGPPE